MIKAVIFDMDGTLIDSEPNYWAAWRDVFSPLGLSISDDEFRRHMGWKSLDVANDFLSMAGATGDAEFLTSQMVETMIEHLPPKVLPGAIDALKLAQKLGLRAALATSASERLAVATVASLGFEPYFEFVVSAENERFGKPHPGVFINAADLLGVTSEECVVIEDAPNGVLAAKAAKMRCICIPEQANGAHPVIAIADCVMTSLTELGPEHLK